MRLLKTRLAGVCAAVAMTGMLSGAAVLTSAPAAAAASVDYDCDDEPRPVDGGPDPGPGEYVTITADQCHRVHGDPREDVWVFSEYYDVYYLCHHVEERGRADEIIGYECTLEE